MIWHATAELGVPAERCWFVGDSPVLARAGQRTCQTVVCRTGTLSRDSSTGTS
jgi:FMN phosphatase YigB (HAD superfamily)